MHEVLHALSTGPLAVYMQLAGCQIPSQHLTLMQTDAAWLLHVCLVTAQLSQAAAEGPRLPVVRGFVEVVPSQRLTCVSMHAAHDSPSAPAAPLQLTWPCNLA